MTKAREGVDGPVRRFPRSDPGSDPRSLLSANAGACGPATAPPRSPRLGGPQGPRRRGLSDAVGRSFLPRTLDSGQLACFMAVNCQSA